MSSHILTSCPPDIGPLQIEVSAEGLQRLTFLDAAPPDSVSDAGDELIRETMAQLSGYFGGKRRQFDLPLCPVGTEFQQAVWRIVSEIPYGQTRSYADIAAAIGDLKSLRAVGRANGQNPLPIVVPCHRVIGSDGQLTGYAGGLARKRWLLAHEKGYTQGTQTRLFE